MNGIKIFSVTEETEEETKRCVAEFTLHISYPEQSVWTEDGTHHNTVVYCNLRRLDTGIVGIVAPFIILLHNHTHNHTVKR